MQSIDNISNNANQVITFVIDDGSTVVLNLIYHPAVERWVANIIHESLTVFSINICLHPNMLRDWKNIIDFGLMCTTIDGIDPLYIDDFSNGRATLYILDKDDINTVENDLIATST